MRKAMSIYLFYRAFCVLVWAQTCWKILRQGRKYAGQLHYERQLAILYIALSYAAAYIYFAKYRKCAHVLSSLCLENRSFLNIMEIAFEFQMS